MYSDILLNEYIRRLHGPVDTVYSLYIVTISYTTLRTLNGVKGVQAVRGVRGHAPPGKFYLLLDAIWWNLGLFSYKHNYKIKFSAYPRGGKP